ncbi:uncharacterized protein LOC133562044 [Nerophis ophidion]|uniref:uncharacterized protein LOC133562044 n=1 Tax=Nerophis ophidion TaxID=159077 RepID=UPI002ADF541D|nr:uncharacterized protein LOC133562044 [Nerophis ophidion]
MADVRWRLLALIVVVTATKTQAIHQDQLTTIVRDVLDRLHVDRGVSGEKLPMFSLAVSVPPGPNGGYDVNAIPDPGDKIRKDLLSCRVYEDEHVLFATALNDKCPNWVENVPEEHAEYRVLSGFKAWAANRKKTGLMLFYVLASPDMSQQGILTLVEDIKAWPQHALVFSKVYQPPGKLPLEVSELTGALDNLGRHLGGLGNIFRCDTGEQCVSCSGGGGQVTPYCYQTGHGQGTQGMQGGRRRRSPQESLEVEPDVCGVDPLGHGCAEQPESAEGPTPTKLPTPTKGPGRKLKRGRGQKKKNKGGSTKRGRGQKKTKKRGGTKRGRGQKKTNKRGGTKRGRGQKKTNKRGKTRSSKGRRRG